MQQNKKNILDRLNEPQILFTLIYVLAITIGMIFNYAKYKKFGINVFDYCDLTDFILFPFSDSKILLFTIVLALFCFVLYYVDIKLRDVFPTFFNKKAISPKQYKTVSLFISTFLFMLFIYIIAGKYSQNIYNNIELSENITIYAKTANYTGKYVGKTSDVIFMYQNNKLHIFPITSNIIYYQIN